MAKRVEAPGRRGALPEVGVEPNRTKSWGRGRLYRHGLWLIPVLLALVFYAPLLSGLWSFPDGDFTHHFFPFALFQHTALADGALPLWNPFTYSGHPFLADVQAAVFYPLSNALLAITLPVTDAAARLYLLQLEAVVQVALGGLFMALLMRDITGSAFGGVVAGAAFALSGYLTGYPPLQLAVLRTAIWLPLVLWCLLRGWQAQPPRQAVLWWLGGSMAAATAFLAGHAQTFLLLAYATAGWFVLLALPVQRQGDGRRAAALGGAGAMVVLAAGLAAAQWIPSLEYLRLSVRANVDYAYVSGGFPWQDTWQILLPGVLTQYSPLYVGAAGLALAVCALVWAGIGRRSGGDEVALPGARIGWRAGVLFFGLVALLALLAAYGANGFLYPLLYRVAPGWGLFRGQERAAYLVAFGLAALAGYGAALAPHLTLGRRRRGAIVAAALVVGGTYAFGMLWQLLGRTAVSQAQYLLIAFWTMGFGLAAGVMVWLPGWSPRRSLGLVGLVALNLVVANMGTNLEPVTPAARVRLAPEMVALRDAVLEQAQDLALPGRVYNEYRIYDDHGMRLEIEDVWGSSPLRLARYARFFEEFPLDRMWRLLGVAHVLTWRRELFGPSLVLGEFPQATDTTYLHRLPDPRPRAWVVDEVLSADDDAAWAYLADHQVDLDRVAVLPAESALTEPPGEPGDHAVTLARRAANRLRVEAHSTGGGLLVVAENWMPGWRVTNVACEADAMDCRPGEREGDLLAPLRANLTLIGVPVPAGSVAFDLVYDPASVRWGLGVSAATLLFVALVGLWAAVRRQIGQVR